MKRFFEGLTKIQRETLILAVTLKTQNEFHLLQPLRKAGMNGVNHGGKIESGLRLFCPSPRGPEKFIAADLADQQFF
jgi:hypothetical protein